MSITVMMRKPMMSCLLGLCLLSTQSASANNGKLSIDRNNIKVWTFQSPDNPAFEYKAETTYDVPMERAVGLILNAEQAPHWAPYVAKVVTLSNDSKKGEFTLYMLLDFPFPLTDRDLVVKGKMIKLSDGSIVIKNNAIEGGYPKQPNRIRLTNYQGDWTFQRLGSNKVKVTTTGFANPEGVIPISFVNLFVQQQPYQMLQKMKVELAKTNTIKPLPDILK